MKRPAFHLLFIASWASACDPNPPSQPLPPRASCALVVVHSDYRSSAVSLLTADGQRCAPDIIDSGSRPPGLLTALSGDVACSTTLTSNTATLALVDRYPAGVLTIIDPNTDRVTEQTQLSQGFAGNPQDLLSPFDGLAIVSRLQRAPTSAAAYPAGSDLLLLGPSPPAGSPRPILGPMSLDAAAAPGFDPMPVRLAATRDHVWVGLAHLTPDFSAAGPGRIACLDRPNPTTDIAAWRADPNLRVIDLPNLENCTGLSPAPDGSGLWVVCSGSFRRGPAQSSRSGLAFITTSGEVRAIFSAASISEIIASPTSSAAPLGFTLAAVDARHAVVVTLGDLVSGAPDRAILVRRPADTTPFTSPATTPDSARVVHESPAFELGDALYLTKSDTLLLADGSPSRPALLRFSGLSSGTLNDLDVFTPTPERLDDTSNTGLPPRNICIFRQP